MTPQGFVTVGIATGYIYRVPVDGEKTAYEIIAASRILTSEGTKIYLEGRQIQGTHLVPVGSRIDLVPPIRTEGPPRITRDI
jgi:hypothetical protein